MYVPMVSPSSKEISRMVVVSKGVTASHHVDNGSVILVLLNHTPLVF